MSERLSVRLVLSRPLSATQLEGLTRAIPDLADVTPTELGNHLSAWPICVVGSVPRSQSAALIKAVTALGVEIEFFTYEDYAAPYIRSLMPIAPSSWYTAEQSLEFQLRPSFSPEVILRLWNDGDTARLQLASLTTSVWIRRFNPPRWLRSRRRRSVVVGGKVVVVRGQADANQQREEPEMPHEVPHDEVTEIAPIDGLLHSALALAEPPGTHGLDGMVTEVTARSGANHISRQLWSPGPSRDPEAYEVLRRAHTLAWDHLREPESRRRLEELHSALGLGFAMEDLRGSPRVIRLWGGLSVHDDPPLRGLLRELSVAGGVLDMTDVPFVAGLLSEAFKEANDKVHFVTPEEHGRLLSNAGIAPRALHTTRADAQAACTG